MKIVMTGGGWGAGPLTLLALLAACADDPRLAASADCGAPADVQGTLVVDATGIVRDDVHVTGTALHPDGLLIRGIAVEGVPATAIGFNFATWEATIPVAVLVASAEIAATGVAPPSGLARLSAVATDACGAQDEVATAEGITVDLTPDTAVESLTLSLANAAELPEGVDYLPADGSWPALIRVVANAAAAGSRFSLQASDGDLSGPDEGNLMLLSGDGASEAEATALLTLDDEGPVVVTATGDDVVATLALTGVGAPALVPAGGTLEAGDTVRVTVLTDGTVDTCLATSSATGAFTASSGGVDLLGAAGEVGDLSGDGRPDVDVEVAATWEGEADLTLACVDVYGQSASAVFSVR